MDATQLIVSTLEGIRKDVADSRQDTSEHFRRVYEKVDATSHEVATVSHDLKNLSARVSLIEKTTEKQGASIGEFLTYKERARMAGSLGSGLWKLGGWVLATAAALVAAYNAIGLWFKG